MSFAFSAIFLALYYLMLWNFNIIYYSNYLRKIEINPTGKLKITSMDSNEPILIDIKDVKTQDFKGYV